MTYTDVTLAPDDIEWGRAGRPTEDVEAFKDSLFDDVLFAEYVAEMGVDDAVRAYTKFHRIVANQLIRRGVTDPDVSDWATRTIALCVRAKRRRQQVRQMLRDRDGTAARDVIAALDVEFPRAEWGMAA